MRQTECPICHTPYGARQRCYRCQPTKRKTGEVRTCAQCGGEFYAQKAQIADTERNSATYCSRECKHAAQRGRVGTRRDADRKIVHSAGYLLVWAPEHPRASRGRVFEHILVMERKLGRPLLPGEFVHHKDRNRKNNHPDNLEIKDNSEHARLHARTNPQAQQRRVTIQCEECGADFAVPPYRASNPDPRTQSKYCSRACRSKAWARLMAEKRRAKREARGQT